MEKMFKDMTEEEREIQKQLVYQQAAEFANGFRQARKLCDNGWHESKYFKNHFESVGMKLNHDWLTALERTKFFNAKRHCNHNLYQWGKLDFTDNDIVTFFRYLHDFKAEKQQKSYAARLANPKPRKPYTHKTVKSVADTTNAVVSVSESAIELAKAVLKEAGYWIIKDEQDLVAKCKALGYIVLKGTVQ